MKKEYKSSIIKNLKLQIKKNLMAFPLKATYLLKLFLDFAPKINISILGISSD